MTSAEKREASSRMKFRRREEKRRKKRSGSFVLLAHNLLWTKRACARPGPERYERSRICRSFIKFVVFVFILCSARVHTTRRCCFEFRLRHCYDIIMNDDVDGENNAYRRDFCMCAAHIHTPNEDNISEGNRRSSIFSMRAWSQLVVLNHLRWFYEWKTGIQKKCRKNIVPKPPLFDGSMPHKHCMQSQKMKSVHNLLVKWCWHSF